MRTVTVPVTEEHISVSEEPLLPALLDALPGAEYVTISPVVLGEPAVAYVALPRRPRWRRSSRTVRVRLPQIAAELAYFARNCPEAVLPITFTIRVPRAAVQS